jgi:hypothetical protein
MADTSAQPAFWTTLAVLSTTKKRADELKSAYMREHGKAISEDKLIAHLLQGATAADLPAPGTGILTVTQR